jgi:hypothetical protein
MKGNDAVWYGVIPAEKMSQSRSPASTAGEHFVMNAGCPQSYLCEYRDVEEKPLPSVGLSYNKRGGVTATISGYHEDSRKEKKGEPYEGIP